MPQAAHTSLRRRQAALLLLPMLLAACQGQFPDGSRFRDPAARAALNEQVQRDVGAMLEGMRQAQAGRYWTSRLRRGD